MLQSGPITVVAVCFAATRSGISGERHVRLQRRILRREQGYAVPTVSAMRRFNTEV